MPTPSVGRLDLLSRQREAGWPDIHPEDYCHLCGGRNISWYADAELWNEAWALIHAERPDVQSVLCPQCFAEAWKRATGLGVTWHVIPSAATLLARIRDAQRAAG